VFKFGTVLPTALVIVSKDNLWVALSRKNNVISGDGVYFRVG
jgi:hypothetical protein